MQPLAIYLGELATQISFAKHAFSSFQRAQRRRQVLPIFYHAHHFLVHASNIDKLLDVSPNSARGRILKPLLAEMRIDLKSFRRLRNHLEHFDERLDRWIAGFRGAAFFDMNVATGAVGFPYKQALRSINDRVFWFHGEKYDLAVLRAEIGKLERTFIDRRLTARPTRTRA
ncbi:MAG: hypothetical protein HY067_09120 [Betaproteobacteria bacterium]|nr:hypothetical protein [Betaproteobacteria bacterium]